MCRENAPGSMERSKRVQDPTPHSAPPHLKCLCSTGFMVGSKAEAGGIAKDGAKMVMAVACADVGVGWMRPRALSRSKMRAMV